MILWFIAPIHAPFEEVRPNSHEISQNEQSVKRITRPLLKQIIVDMLIKHWTYSELHKLKKLQEFELNLLQSTFFYDKIFYNECNTIAVWMASIYSFKVSDFFWRTVYFKWNC